MRLGISVKFSISVVKERLHFQGSNKYRENGKTLGDQQPLFSLSPILNALTIGFLEPWNLHIRKGLHTAHLV